MEKIFKLTALLLLVLWGPATQHCDLKAADLAVFFTDGSHDSYPCAELCSKDSCEVSEGDSLRWKLSSLRVLPPVDALHFCLMSLLTPPAAVEREPVSLANDPPEIQALHRTWQFVRRTALPARAPGFAA